MKGDYAKFKYLTHIEAWNIFHERYPDSKVGYREFRQVIKTLGQRVEEHVFTNPMGVELPDGLGIFQIVGYIPRAFYTYAKKYKVRTDGFYYKMFLLKRAVNAKLPFYDKFYWKMTKQLQSRLVERILKDEFFDWVKVLNNKKVLDLIPERKTDVI
jgi:hypothetical protein